MGLQYGTSLLRYVLPELRKRTEDRQRGVKERIDRHSVTKGDEGVYKGIKDAIDP